MEKYDKLSLNNFPSPNEELIYQFLVGDFVDIEVLLITKFLTYRVGVNGLWWTLLKKNLKNLWGTLFFNNYFLSSIIDKFLFLVANINEAFDEDSLDPFSNANNNHS